MAKCLVTGGAGFIGSNLVDALAAEDHEVVITDDLSTGKREYLNPKAKFCEIDICSDKVENIFREEKFDFVFHLAAQIDVRISVSDPKLDNKINVLGGVNILENCRKFKIKKIIFASTGGAVYGDATEIPTSEDYPPYPVSPYGIHKLTFEKYLNYYYKVYGQKYIALRFANIYGPRQYKGGEAGVVSIFVDNAVNDKKSVINGDGKQTRDYVYVDDVVKALIASTDNNYNGEINIGTGVETNLLDIIKAIESAMGGEIKKEHGEAKEGEQMRSCLDNSLAEKVLKWKPEVNLEDGIRRTIEWSKKFIKL
jgi:UDP-glucose 4-epimerase